ncbi:MAG: OmpH family outer membrane protein [Breznakibacter sp.]|nr:OmpH family outer membrane protein [Breznakibacter sp.]
MTKLFYIPLLVTLLFASSATLCAQSSLKFGHIISQKVILEMPEYAANEKAIKDETTKLEKQLTDMREAFQTLVGEYQQVAQTLSAEERSAREANLGERSKKIQDFYQTAQQSLEAKAKALQEPLMAKLQKAISAVGEEKGLLYIFEVEPGLPVYFSTKSVDVTELVKAKLAPSTPAAVSPAK